MSKNQQPVHEVYPLQPPVITQRAMVDFLALEANYRLVKKRFDDEKQLMIERLQNPDTQIEEGQLMAVLHIDEKKIVAWKEEFIKEFSKQRADEITELVEPTKIYRPKVVVRPTIKL